jgi:leucyl/phenylalanyl-tRNA--protein transferase
MIPWLNANDPFPDVSQALTQEHGAAGLLAAGADLSAERLIEAYSHGIFPWYSQGQPVLWWSTDPRMVLLTKDFHVSTNLKKLYNKTMKDHHWTFSFDTAFEEVIRACSEPRHHQDGTWISEEIIRAYTDLHQLGLAHSSEVWFDGQLVGGAYGVCLGKMFYGESMFARLSNASKMAFVHLVRFLREQKVEMIDCQQETSHLTSFGAKPISRDDFLVRMNNAIQLEPISHWTAMRYQPIKSINDNANNN